MLKIYNEYQKYGVKDYYKNYSKEYYNPHQDKIKNIYKKYLYNIVSRNDKIIDIACGDGLISKIINEFNNNDKNNKNIMIDGSDPYFDNIYTTLKYSFEDIAKGKLNELSIKYDIAICCYAFHLIDEKWKYDFLSNMAINTSKFIIITPSKKIKINHPLWKIVKEIRDDKITIIILDNNL
jgi:hypothetical protein